MDQAQVLKTNLRLPFEQGGIFKYHATPAVTWGLSFSGLDHLKDHSI
jgi:hypothetical protein